MTDKEFDRQSRELFKNYRSSDAIRKDRSRAAARAYQRRERAVARAEVRRDRRRSRMLHFAGDGGGSIARTILGSFDTVLEIVLAIVLLFAMYGNAASYSKMLLSENDLSWGVYHPLASGVTTPMHAVLDAGSAASAQNDVGDACLNLAGTDAKFGFGWAESGGEIRPLFFDLDSFVTKVREFDVDGEGDVFTRGVAFLIKTPGLLFKNAFLGDHFGSFGETSGGAVDFIFNDTWSSLLDGFFGQVLSGISKFVFGIFGGGS